MTGIEATAAVIQALEAEGLSYFLSGSLASNFYGIPRSTHDADFVVQLGNATVSVLLRHLGAEFRLDPQLSFETVTGTTRHVLDVAGEMPFQVEIFRLGDDAHDQARFCRRRQVFVPELHLRAFLPTPEDVIVTKLRWALLGRRSKDREDVRDVIAVQGGGLDWEYVFRWCDQHGTRDLLEEIRRSTGPAGNVPTGGAGPSVP